MHSDAATVAEYVESLTEPRRGQMQRVLAAIRPHLPDELVEEMAYGMITWSIPLSIKPDTYNGKPLMFGGLASQKNHTSLYLTNIYVGVPISEEEFRARWTGAKKLNMGKSCVRFRTIDDIDVDLIQEVLDSSTVADVVAAYEAVRRA